MLRLPSLLLLPLLFILRLRLSRLLPCSLPQIRLRRLPGSSPSLPLRDASLAVLLLVRILFLSQMLWLVSVSWCSWNLVEFLESEQPVFRNWPQGS